MSDWTYEGHAVPISADALRMWQARVETQSLQPQQMIVSPRQYERLEWHYRVIRWDRAISWDLLVAPRLTRFLGRLRRARRRLREAWQALRGENW